MPKNNSNDLIQDPIKIAVQTIAFQQEPIMSQLQGPQAAQRRQMVGDVPLEDILPQVLAEMAPEQL